MQDRFKFRVWEVREKRFVDFSRDDVKFFIDNNGQLNRVIVYGPSENIPGDTHFFTQPNEKFYKVNFCVGLKDKNGKLIFEGDILKDDSSTFKVEYRFCEYHLEHIGGAYQYPAFFSNAKRLEIIGNIYENSELLEGICATNSTT